MCVESCEPWSNLGVWVWSLHFYILHSLCWDFVRKCVNRSVNVCWLLQVQMNQQLHTCVSGPSSAGRDSFADLRHNRSTAKVLCEKSSQLRNFVVFEERYFSIFSHDKRTFMFSFWVHILSVILSVGSIYRDLYAFSHQHLYILYTLAVSFTHVWIM